MCTVAASLLSDGNAGLCSFREAIACDGGEGHPVLHGDFPLLVCAIVVCCASLVLELLH